ncbi:MAG: hypothetical protein JWN67_42 [Actinomycetia bacterium]|nr:hypothetical protein [Actinomycetes bacterium]
MSDEIPFLDHLGDQLRRADGPPRPDRRPLLRRSAGVAVVLALATIAFNTVRSDPVAAGVDVRRVGNRVELRVEGDAPPASEIEEIAHRNGLDIDVSEEPVGPSEVGQLFTGESTIGAAGVRYGPQQARVVPGAGFEVVSFPVNWKGYLDLVIGRAARPGEDQYWHPSNALARGEVFACLRGATAEEVQATAERHHVTVRWWVYEPDGITLRQDLPFDPRWTADGYRAAYASAVGPRSVIIELTPGGRVVEPRSFSRFPSC